MTLRQLEYLIAVIEDGSFTRAAERLRVSQPALSHQIRALERSVGGALLERPPRPVRPTALGRELLPHAIATVHAAQAATDAARAVDALEAGELRVATLYSIALGLVVPAIHAWRLAHPRVHVELFEFTNVPMLAAQMADGVADLAIGSVPPGWTGTMRPLGTERFLVVLAPDDPLLGPADRAVELRALADRQWVLYPPDSSLAPIVADACEAAGFVPVAAVRTYHTGTAVELAAAGLGPALVPASVVGPDFADCARPAEPPVSRALAAFTRGEPTRPAAAFTDLLLEYVET